MKDNLVFVLILIISVSCKTKQTFEPVHSPVINIQEIKLDDFKNWHFKDLQLDTVPGISLNRAYDSLLTKDRKDHKTIVAVIDNETDINHKDLAHQIWVNKKEIADNQIDDDNNGYVDDIHGWNFLGNAQGENNKYVNFESTRILRKLTPYFKDKDTTNLNPNDAKLFSYYQKVKKRHEVRLKYFLAEKDNYDRLYDFYFAAVKEIAPYFKNRPYTLEAIDSLKQSKSTNIDDFHFLVMTDCLKNNIDDSLVLKEKKHATNMVEKLLVIEYNDREIQGDNPDDITDTIYGNNLMSNNVEFLNHGTKMSGIITGISRNNEVEIMPLAISAYGDEHDKDIALSIRYAVDNGAKVINMSFWKEFSLYENWVLDAIKYADQNDVLIISIAGNDGLNLNQNVKYPNDKLTDGTEVSDNFILVGASNHNLNKGFVPGYSNYGTIDVDLFAPGNEIYTTSPNNTYVNNSGGTSSSAAVTSGVAALIRSYYPDLTASEVKHILMDSGVEYTLEVATPTEEDPEKTTPFNQLSKSGKVLNAYNALLMAERISKGKRK
ncbi:peptidase S8 [Nonlabens sp. MB-3u-79]|uniref:S8 family serine peptidase n=1 Tax=Nonlabens sp. MB-3u-79 TaxID=2058134 RepID=UPI000C31B102|nr:S8 family serine peptidase [Nonlabens sp. MB-3u-79]AUC78261.1 peptidase S8 [Nonlabens sp. MB-3u-79]